MKSPAHIGIVLGAHQFLELERPNCPDQATAALAQIVFALAPPANLLFLDQRANVIAQPGQCIALGRAENLGLFLLLA
jgi:hypothetical protein